MIRKRNITLIFALVSASITLLSFQNCSKGFKTTRSEFSSFPSNCPTKVGAYPVLEKTSSEFSEPGQKINFSDFSRAETSSGFQKTSTQFTIKASEKLTITVSQECLLNRDQSQDSPLTEGVKRRKVPKKFSDLASHTITVSKDITFSDLEALANNDECVEIVSPDLVIKKSAAPNDPYLVNQKHLAAIEYSQNYDYYFTDAKKINSDTLIAVIDDGIDLTHPELKDLFWNNPGERNGTAGVDDDGNGYIDDINGYDFYTRTGDPSHKIQDEELLHSHGTHVTGLITATTNNFSGLAGLMAKNSKVMALNIFGNKETTSSANIDSAIRYAADMGAKIINMSVGGKGSSAAIEQALRYAVSKGATVIVAAGNDGETLTSSNVFSPASYASSIAGVISVGATDANTNSIGTLCSFSNRSTTYVELAAPGCDTSRGSQGILSSVRNNKYAYLAGTSMASPVAAGTAAVLYSYARDAHSKNLTPAEVENLLVSGSRSVASLGSTIKSGKNANLSELKSKIIATYGSGGTTNPPTTPPTNPPTQPEEPKDECE